MKSYFDLTGQVAVVTGCSAGLGVQMAKALASAGAAVVAAARRKEKTEAVAAEIAARFSVATLALSCDVTDTAQVDAMADDVLRRFGRIDILVNNAGTGAVAPAQEISDEQLWHELDVDLCGTFRAARAVAAKAMIPARYGRIINIASMYGLQGNLLAPSAPYHAAKGGVVNLTRALAAEWGSYGITVNAVCPGYFFTDLTRETLLSEPFARHAKQNIPLARFGEEGELDTAVLFFAAKKSSYVNGVSLPVDGGCTAV